MVNQLLKMKADPISQTNDGLLEMKADATKQSNKNLRPQDTLGKCLSCQMVIWVKSRKR
jgi:hypothetical protein